MRCENADLRYPKRAQAGDDTAGLVMPRIAQFCLAMSMGPRALACQLAPGGAHLAERERRLTPEEV